MDIGEGKGGGGGGFYTNKGPVIIYDLGGSWRENGEVTEKMNMS